MMEQLQGTRWSIILAGGEGERTRPFIEQWLGCHIPKQYCAFVGNRTMLEHTWDRADRLTSPEHKLTVVARGHHRLAWRHLEKQEEGKILFQPSNLNTAPGVFLPLTYIRAWDPQATVIIYPSDHFIFPEEQFVEEVRKAVRAVDWLSDRLILLGAIPTHGEVEYGWIEPGGVIGWSQGRPVKEVTSFLEKPTRSLAMKMLAKGGVWNTMVVAAKVETLWGIGWECIPEVMSRFEQLIPVIGTSQEGPTLEKIYEDMPTQNFSADLLAQIPHRIGVLELEDVMWSDWGNPTRILDTLQQIGKVPSFPGHIISVPYEPVEKAEENQFMNGGRIHGRKTFRIQKERNERRQVGLTKI